MPEPDKEVEGNAEPPRSDEARRVIEEYAAELREIIRKLRRKMS